MAEVFTCWVVRRLLHQFLPLSPKVLCHCSRSRCLLLFFSSLRPTGTKCTAAHCVKQADERAPILGWIALFASARSPQINSELRLNCSRHDGMTKIDEISRSLESFSFPGAQTQRATTFSLSGGENERDDVCVVFASCKCSRIWGIKLFASACCKISHRKKTVRELQLKKWVMTWRTSPNTKSIWSKWQRWAQEFWKQKVEPFKFGITW